MIAKLKKRFILLAMVSLAALLTVIVAGMNIINYNTVVSQADETLEALSQNKGRLPVFFDDGLDDMIDNLYINDPFLGYDDIDASTGDYPSGKTGHHGKNNYGGRGGNAPDWMTRDEAEETRYFTVLADQNGNIIRANTSHIFSVDQSAAKQYAEEILSSGKTYGFVDDLRYSVVEESGYSRVTFLDCGRTLDSFRKFLYASIGMSVAGLLAVFGIICFFAGRIVRPVAESYEKQKRFITDAGHEIKTPLTIIKANLDVMRMELEDGEDVSESIEDIDSQVGRLTTLTNDLVYLSRMEEDPSLTMTEVPLSEIVSETAASFEPVAAERDKTISQEIAPLLSVRGSTKELEKLGSILMENALKYSPEGDSIGVSLRQEGRNVILEVRNKTLTPVADEDLAHVFERFYRTDKSRNSAAGGHGIGLSMASAIVSAHGGKIRAHSGDGTEFIVSATLPA